MITQIFKFVKRVLKIVFQLAVMRWKESSVINHPPQQSEEQASKPVLAPGIMYYSDSSSYGIKCRPEMIGGLTHSPTPVTIATDPTLFRLLRISESYSAVR